MDARNVFSHPNLEQTIRPINIVVDGSDKPQVWEERREVGEPKEPPGVGSNNNSNNSVDLLHCYKLRASGAQLPPRQAGEEVKEGRGVTRGICRGSVQRERERVLHSVPECAFGVE